MQVYSTAKRNRHRQTPELIQTVIANNPKAVADYKGGNKNTLMFMVGQVMREMKGQADAMTVKSELEKALR